MDPSSAVMAVIDRYRCAGVTPRPTDLWRPRVRPLRTRPTERGGRVRVTGRDLVKPPGAARAQGSQSRGLGRSNDLFLGFQLLCCGVLRVFNRPSWVHARLGLSLSLGSMLRLLTPARLTRRWSCELVTVVGVTRTKSTGTKSIENRSVPSVRYNAERTVEVSGWCRPTPFSRPRV